MNRPLGKLAEANLLKPALARGELRCIGDLDRQQKLHTLKVAMFNEEIGEKGSNLISVINL